MILKNLDKSKKYLLALSGGIDSMVMADMFLKQNFSFCVAHCNFHLRENDSNLDEKLVTDWCTKNNIQFFINHSDTNAYCVEHKCSIQVAAREIRYAFFESICKQEKLDFIATAHHQDDNIETTLFQFFRGTGIQGLTGIPAKNKNIIRPLLNISKQKIIDYSIGYNIQFRNDKSNFKEDYTRNKLRLNIIPQLEEIFPSFKNNIAQNIERMNGVNEIYHQQISQYRKKLIERRGLDFYIPILKLKTITPIETILFELIKPFQFSFEQTLQVIQLIDRQTGSLVESATHKIIKNRNFLIITKIESNESEIILINKEDLAIQTSKFNLQIKTVEKENFILQKRLSICYVDESKLEYPLLLRKWRQGDYLYPFGMTKKKKVSKVLIDAKIPLHEKDSVWVLESNKKILWVVGLKADNRFRITDKTQAIVLFEIK